MQCVSYLIARRCESCYPGCDESDSRAIEAVHQKFRSQQMGTLRYCCELLALDTPSAMFQHMCEVPLVCERWFENIIGAIKTRRGSQDFIQQSAAGTWTFIAEQLLSPLSSEFATRVQIARQLVDTEGTSYVQRKTWELNVRFVGELVMSMCLYQNPPFGFLRLPFAESDWRVTPGIRLALERLRNSVHSTLAIENMFNKCRRAQSAAANNALSASAAFYHAAQPAFLAEYDRTVPTRTGSAMHDVASLPEWDHDKDSCACSVEEPYLTELMQPATWKTHSPQTLKVASLQWQVLSRQPVDATVSHTRWHSTLLRPGQLLCSRDTSSPGIQLVIYTCSEGYVGWRASFNKTTKLITLHPSVEHALVYGCIDDVTKWQVAEVLVQSSSSGSTDTTGVMQLRMGVSHNLLKYCAKRGFETLNGKQLQTLATDLSVPPALEPKKETEAEVLNRMVRHVLGTDCTDIVMKQALDCRNLTLESDSAVDVQAQLGDAPLLDDAAASDDEPPDAVDEEVLDAWAQKELSKAAARERSEVHPHIYDKNWKEATDAADRRGQQSSSSSTATAATTAANTTPGGRKFNPVPCKSYSAKEAKKFLPEKGFSLSKDVRENRWRLVTDYPVTEQKSKSYGKTSIEDDHDALLFVLRNAWRAYYRVHQIECPWNLDALERPSSMS
eukprot:3350417-Amphidinium_carterae.1